jgi:MFS family permease
MTMLFLFFLIATLASSGIAAFSQVVNVTLYGVSLETAGTALSGFLFASTAGILLGGIAADKTTRHDAQAAVAFLLCGVIFAALAIFTVGDITLILLFVAAGLAHGMIRPARDMMVRALAPRGTAGRAFAWASTGMSVGGAVAPILFGLMVDFGATAEFYWVIAAFNVLAILTVTSTRWVKRAATTEQPAE